MKMKRTREFSENCLKEHRHEKNKPFKECQVRKSTLMSHKSAFSVAACPLESKIALVSYSGTTKECYMPNYS